MARTGSGKSLAYLIPLVQRLGGRHSTTFGARALILLPTRELALQILKVGKELARGYSSNGGEHAGDSKGDDDGKKGQGLRWGLVVGGEGLDEQFEMISNNPDVYVYRNVSLGGPYSLCMDVIVSLQHQADYFISSLK